MEDRARPPRPPPPPDAASAASMQRKRGHREIIDLVSPKRQRVDHKTSAGDVDCRDTQSFRPIAAGSASSSSGGSASSNSSESRRKAAQGGPFFALCRVSVLPHSVSGCSVSTILEPGKIYRVGRLLETSQIWLDSKRHPNAISERHATIRHDGKNWSIIDENSARGTFVNEQRLTPKKWRTLLKGDVIAFAEPKMTSEFLFEFRQANNAEQIPKKLSSGSKSTLNRQSSAVRAVQEYLASEKLARELQQQQSEQQTAQKRPQSLQSHKNPRSLEQELRKVVWLWKQDLNRNHDDPLAWEPFGNCESDIIERQYMQGSKKVFVLNNLYSIDLHLLQQFRTTHPDKRRAILRDVDQSKPEAKKERSKPNGELDPSMSPPKSGTERIRRHTSSSAIVALEIAGEVLDSKKSRLTGKDGVDDSKKDSNASVTNKKDRNSEEALDVTTGVSKGKLEKRSSDEEVAQRLAEELVALGANRSAFDCPCCMCECEPFAGLVLSCSHPICLDCLRAFGRQKIDSRQLVQCPTCQEPIPHTDLGRVLGEQDVKKYIAIEALNIRNDKDAKLFNCQTPDCPNSVIVDFPKPKEPEPSVEMFITLKYGELRRIKGLTPRLCRLIRQQAGGFGGFKDWDEFKQITNASAEVVNSVRQHLRTRMPKPPEPSDARFRWPCTACKEIWCVRCKVPWHEGETCLDVKLKDKFKEGEDKMMELVKKGELFKCTCDRYIVKAEGCKYMTCECGKHFCWGCKQLLESDHQDHECKVAGMYMPEDNVGGGARVGIRPGFGLVGRGLGGAFGGRPGRVGQNQGGFGGFAVNPFVARALERPAEVDMFRHLREAFGAFLPPPRLRGGHRGWPRHAPPWR